MAWGNRRLKDSDKSKVGRRKKNGLKRKATRGKGAPQSNIPNQ